MEMGMGMDLFSKATSRASSRASSFSQSFQQPHRGTFEPITQVADPADADGGAEEGAAALAASISKSKLDNVTLAALLAVLKDDW